MRQSPNPALNLAPFGRWTALKRRRLALRWASTKVFVMRTSCRLVGLIFALLTSSACFAGCSGSITGGGSGTEHYVDISDDGCLHSEVMINGEYRFGSECKMTEDASSFTCKANGKTPISGATYVLRKDAKPVCEGEKYGERYKCVKGCTKTTPKYLYVFPYEC